MTVAKCTLRLILALISLSTLVPQLTTKAWADSYAIASFEPPPGRDAPRGGTVGGGSRPVQTACLSSPTATSSSLTALSPGHHLGLTQAPQPSFFVYLPQTTAQSVEFSLFDEQMNGIYQVNLPVSQQAGLVNIRLPETAPALAQDKPYYWSVALVCTPSDRTQDLVVGGWIERAEVSENLKQQLASVAAIDRVSVYAKQGFWYDALTTLVELQRTEPNNPKLAALQAGLLQSVGLEAISLALP
ncbi:DUF928 domain-containing protein [Microcoleus sp. FACHB-SPT15]|uniref:DUF928 domain-containing protein n=1 Tax=Microcoleus sp. FACHB-SPT15 TaxID=2692830 RepID=UPI00177C214E|nr:DUF928 domain-containing protein [Microcoleus sp. FACHB-SPT15]MBD1804515.1 DUF928 domain-containing protein [Microcoleus sp. FACHB-SPT15]